MKKIFIGSSYGGEDGEHGLNFLLYNAAFQAVRFARDMSDLVYMIAGNFGVGWREHLTFEGPEESTIEDSQGGIHHLMAIPKTNQKLLSYSIDSLFEEAPRLAA